jgi:hypothetical protein
MENLNYNQQDEEKDVKLTNRTFERSVDMRASMGFIKEAQRKPSYNIDSNSDRKSVPEFLRGSHNTFIQARFVSNVSSDESESDCYSDSDNEEDGKLVKTIVAEKYKYVGEVKNGRKDGFGVCYYTTGDKYVGYWENDLKCGLGKLTLKNGKTFSGEFSDNSVDGFVEYTNNQGVVHHGFMRGFKFIPGEPLIMKNSKCLFMGRMKYTDGKLIGIGRYNYSNGGKYEGEICDYAECGLGIYYKHDGYIFKGENKERVFNGFCEVIAPDRSIHLGNYKNNVKDGLSISISPEGIYTVGVYSEETKNGGFLTLAKECTKFEIWLWGFCVKSVEKKENVISYVNTVYPEYKYLLRLKNNKIWNLFKH